MEHSLRQPVWVKGYYDKDGDIIIPLSKSGGFHRIVMDHAGEVETKEFNLKENE